MKTQVAIVGAGPAGTLLSLILKQRGIDSVVIERQTKDYVLGRIRAGVLEWTSVEILRAAGIGDRLDAEGHRHDSVKISWRAQDILSIDFERLTGKPMMSYGQTKVQEDLYAAAEREGINIVFGASDVEIHDVTTNSPSISCVVDGEQERIECDYVAGCDGQHGVSRRTIPSELKSEFEMSYPFGWLGILSETPPLPYLIYANHENGFALCSERNPMLSRYYVQCPLEDTVEDWSDDRFWSELTERLPSSVASELVTGPSIEKSIAPLRSYVVEPMQYGRMFLAGDAAHIVPPTGAKGLNLAIADVHYLSEAFDAHYGGGDSTKLDGYSETALRRVWSSVRFSWWMTVLLHRFPDQTPFEQRMREEDLAYLTRSEAAQRSVAEQYVGLDL
ncbi:MAG: 4-hydroxybenzoate 3-monooxygenase [Acidimicrobiales bacterium]|nr:4-hydroxybenzoate 3-monooxygenase [Acidimicrobiales bacterium]RZV48252.1 MAG: 4-hydroxybenzoate 3-monooxygenase [Acidimicrobiales bacterium]